MVKEGGAAISLASVFTEKERNALQEYCGIVLSDDREYSRGDLLGIYDLVCDMFPYEYDHEGRPLELGWIFENIVDKLVDL